MKIGSLGKQIFIGDNKVALVNKYNYLGHKIQISRDNQTCEIKRRVTLSWAAYGKLADVFKSDMPQCLKRKVFDQCVLPVMTYGAETLTLTTASANKLMVTQRKMERSMLGVSLRDHIRNEDLRRRTGVTDVVNQIRKLKWNWAGHVARMSWRRLRLDKRSKGRPPTHWTDDLKRFAGNWIQRAQDRKEWVELGEAYVQQWTRRAE